MIECTYTKNKGVIMTKGRPRKSTYLDLTCEVCKKHYTQPSYAKTGLRFCSLDCSFIGRKGEAKPRRKIDPVPIECPECKIVFMTGGRNRPRYGTKFCSNICRGKYSSTQPDVREMSEAEISWLAGLFDGEGNIAWPRKGNIHTARLTITNTNYALLEKLIEITGTGSIVGYKKSKNHKHADAWNWSCYGDRSKQLLELMLTWLIVKRENAEIVLEAAKANEMGLPSPRQPIQPNRSK